MYAFKIVVTTLILIVAVIIAYTGLKSPKQTKTAAIIVEILYAMCLIAIWG